MVLNPIPGAFSARMALAATRAYRNAAFTTANTTFNKLPLDTISYDQAGNFSLAQGRYNVPQAGRYFVIGETATSQNPGDNFAVIYRNGAAVTWGLRFQTTSVANNAVVSDVLACAAGDYLELYLYTAFASTLLTTPTYNYLAVIPLRN